MSAHQIRGAHAPRVLAIAPSRSRTFPAASRRYLKQYFGEAQKSAREVRAGLALRALPNRSRLAVLCYLANDTRFFQSGVCPILIDRFEAARRHLDAHKFFQFGHPNAVFMQIRAENARHVFGHVTPNAALFLGHTTPVNHAPARGSGTCNTANSGHTLRQSRVNCRATADWSSDS